MIATAQTQNNKTVSLESAQTPVITHYKGLGNICAICNVLLFRKNGPVNNKTPHFKGNYLSSYFMPHKDIIVCE